MDQPVIIDPDNLLLEIKALKLPKCPLDDHENFSMMCTD